MISQLKMWINSCILLYRPFNITSFYKLTSCEPFVCENAQWGLPMDHLILLWGEDNVINAQVVTPPP